MQHNDFDMKLRKIEKPYVSLPEHERRLRLAYANAQRSMWWGLLLIFLPTVFVLGAVLKFVLGIPYLYDFFIGPIVETMDTIEVGGLSLSPIVFLGGLFLAFIINVLAVLHISIDNLKTEVVIHLSFKKRFWNFAIIFVAILTVTVLLTYVVLENWPCLIGLEESC